jgi:hypothetical protein
MRTWSYEHIPSTVYLITARYRPQAAEPYESFMISELGKADELWLHVEYTLDAGYQTMAILQDSLERLERGHAIWPTQLLVMKGTQLVTMAQDAPTSLPGVVGYVHDMQSTGWPKGRAQYVYWENIRGSTQPTFG